MYWLQPPPYLRRAAAVLLIAAAFLWDLRGTPTAPYPVAAADIASGTALTAQIVSWVDLPADRLPLADLAGATAARDISAGEPLTSAVLSSSATVPPEWWTVPIGVGKLAMVGDEVLLVVTDPPLTTTGIVVAPQVGERFSLDFRPASVAVPPDVAPLIAAADREGFLSTAIRTPRANR